MKALMPQKLTDVYEELKHLEQQGQLNFTGVRELAVCEYILFGRKS